MITETLPLIVMMLSTGVVAGLVAGLLGVGGGIIIVPVLDFALSINGVDPGIRMHLAVATSLSTIIPTSISSGLAHHKKGAVDLKLIKSWGVPVFIGSGLGACYATGLESRLLAIIFASAALLVGVKMILPLKDKTLGNKPPTSLKSTPIPLFIGWLSSMMGIGGGTLSVPILTLFSIPIHRAVGTAAVFGLIISIPGTIGYILGGLGHPNLPAGSLGFVNIVGFFILVPMTILSAPYGAKVAHRLNQNHLSIAFGAFLLFVGVRMLDQVL